MPYFERKPYEQLVKAAEAISPPSGFAQVPSTPSIPARSPLVEQAASILREESRTVPNSQAEAVGAPIPGLTASLPVVLRAAPAKAGAKASVTISLVNTSGDSVSYSFAFTDLVSVAGERIPSTGIAAFPANAAVPPCGAAEVRIEIEVPRVPAGDYTGLLLCRETAPAMLTINVSA